MNFAIPTYGMLVDYYTSELIRPATKTEQKASIAAAEKDGGAGVILIGVRRCYVDDEK